MKTYPLFKILFLTSFFFSSLVQAQSKISELKFASLYEQQVFQNFEQNNLDSLGLFLSYDEKASMDLSEKFKDRIFKEMDKYISNYKKPKKGARYIKDVFAYTHNRFLKRYETETYFRTLEDGVYNCVSASALYAMVFERYGIPYVIKEAPTHVYLVAEPGTLNITIETTSPNAGYFLPDEKFKASYITFLLESKSVTQEEVALNGKNKTFEKYYYEQSNITLSQLAGLQYYNLGIELFNENKFDESFFQFEKAYFLYSSDRIRMMLLGSSGYQLDGNTLTDTTDVNLMIRSREYEKGAKAADVFVHNFEVFTKRHLFERNNIDYYNRIYNKVIVSSTESAFNSRISAVYYENMGRLHMLNGNTKTGMSHLEKAMDLNPENQEVLGLIIAGLSDQANRTENCGDELYKYSLKYKKLAENKRFMEMMCVCYLKSAGLAFLSNNTKVADKQLSKFEEIYHSSENINISPEAVAYAYANGSSLFVQLNNYPLAKRYLQRGLKYAPSSTELNRKMRVLNGGK